MAITARRPRPGLIFHSDRGSQYTSATFRELLGAHGVVQSLSRPRQCWDNAVAEIFFATLKTELVYRSARPTRGAVRRASSSSSRCSTIASGCTPRSVTAPPRSTRPRCFHAQGSLRRPKQTVRQTGASPGIGFKLPDRLRSPQSRSPLSVLSDFLHHFGLPVRIGGFDALFRRHTKVTVSKGDSTPMMSVPDTRRFGSMFGVWVNCGQYFDAYAVLAIDEAAYLGALRRTRSPRATEAVPRASAR